MGVQNLDTMQRSLPNMVLVALWVLGFGLFFCGMPKYYDDIWYLVDFRPWFAEQGIESPENGGNMMVAGIPWDEYSAMIDYRYSFDNMRLTNQIGAFLLLLPKWVGSSLMTLLWGWTLLIAVRLTGYNWRTSPATPLLIFAFTFLLPWQDHFGSMIYQINYVLPCWLSLALYIWLRRPRHSHSERLLAVLAGFMLGVCHEGFAAPVAAGLCALFILCKSWRRREVVLTVITICAGVSLLLYIPATDIYFSGKENTPVPLSSVAEQMMFYGFPYFIFLILYISILLQKSKRKTAADPLLIFAQTSGATLAVIYLCAKPEPRATFWMTFMALVAITHLIRLQTGERFNKYRLGSAIVATLLSIIVFIHLGAVDARAFELRRVKRDAEAGYLKNGHRYQFGDVKINGRSNPLTFNRPEANYPVLLLAMQINYYENNISRVKNIYIIPRQLRYISGASGQSVSDDSIIRYKDGFHFIPAEMISANSSEILKSLTADNDNPQYIPLQAKFGEDSSKIMALPIHFRSEADGKDYYWLYYTLPWSTAHFNPIPELCLPTD